MGIRDSLMRAAILSFYDFGEVQGGIELFSRHLAPAFDESEHLTFSQSQRYSVGPRLTRLNLEFPRMAWAIGRELRRRHEEHPFDVAVSSDISGLATALTAPDIPAIMVFHYTYKSFSEAALSAPHSQDPSRLLTPWMERFAAAGKTVVAVSPKVKRTLRRQYGIEARLIENGIPLDIFRPTDKAEARRKLGIDWKGPLGIFVGRTDRTKGFDIVQAVARARRDVRILCVSGKGCDLDYMIMAEKVVNSSMPLYYSAADFLLFPSRYESLSYASIEALACDLPVVASRTGIFEDVDPARVGVVLRSEDPKDYSKGIDRVLDMHIHPRELAVERFSIERFRSDYARLAAEVTS
ncbi:MAG: glycosyltransferase family 4 protein [Methanomassiliicoccales archaeon]|nr:glycosyltransferase family 4 protein [Methanomassiliicoccales archaeon]